MWRRLLRRILSEPEAATAVAALSVIQATCPAGICLEPRCAAHGASPTGGTLVGAIIVRLLRRTRGRPARRTRNGYPAAARAVRIAPISTVFGGKSSQYW